MRVVKNRKLQTKYQVQLTALIIFSNIITATKYQKGFDYSHHWLNHFKIFGNLIKTIMLNYFLQAQVLNELFNY